MEEQKIKVLALLPMELPKEIELDNTLEAICIIWILHGIGFQELRYRVLINATLVKNIYQFFAYIFLLLCTDQNIRFYSKRIGISITP